MKNILIKEKKFKSNILLKLSTMRENLSE